jgi:siroheme synthase-like protein
MTDARPTAFYPAFLKLEGLPVVVVGAGTVAAGKLDALLLAGARVTVVAPQITQAIRAREDVVLVERGFVASDLDGARWVVAAAPPEVNREVAAAAAARSLFVNAVDDTASATAYLGGVVRRGTASGSMVEVAISTRGVAPALAGLLREALDAVLPAELERWIEVAKTERVAWKNQGVPMAQRRPLLLQALNRIYGRTDPATPARRHRILRAIDRLYAHGWSA